MFENNAGIYFQKALPNFESYILTKQIFKRNSTESVNYIHPVA